MPDNAARKDFEQMAMLTVTDLQVYYGVIQAIKGISFSVNQGEVIALIGANGAGKTTTLHTVTGLIQPKAGKIEFEGKDITKMPAHKIVSLGMAHVPEGRRIFQQLTVLDNLKLGAYTRKDKKKIADTLEMVYRRFPRLEERKKQIAGTLSGGEQQMLAMGRALMSEPKIIVMDEPTSALDPISTAKVEELALELKKDYTIVMVTHNMQQAARISDRTAFFLLGEIVEFGKTEQIFSMPKDKRTEDYITGRFG